MCGRFTNHTPPDVFARLFRAKPGEVTLPPHHNIAPSSDVLACRETSESGRELVLRRWGLVPSWAKDPKTGYKVINARAETVAEKPAFRAAFKHRRCLVAADGFYEWQPAKPRRQPYYIRLKNGQPFAFAGLWEHWEQEGRTIESCTIIVTDANKLLASIHDRMPVILSPDDFDRWLVLEPQDPATLASLLRPYPAKEMEAYPVGILVNSPRNDRAELLEPARAAGCYHGTP